MVGDPHARLSVNDAEPLDGAVLVESFGDGVRVYRITEGKGKADGNATRGFNHAAHDLAKHPVAGNEKAIPGLEDRVERRLDP
jgi:hypothetical protein